MENQKSGSISTQLNISNNDIVTMLLEERKEQLKKEIISLQDQKREVLESYVGVMANKLDEFYTSPEFLIFKEKMYEFAKMYNPDVEFELVIGNDLNSEEEVRGDLRHYYSLRKTIKITPSYLHIQAVNDEDEGNINYFYGGEDYIDYPPHLKREFKMDVSKEDSESYDIITSKIGQYENEMRNSNNMRDKLVAKMTKAAIMNNPDLLAIRDSVLKLE